MTRSPDFAALGSARQLENHRAFHAAETRIREVRD
jgi:hypothetical protein